MSKNSMWKSATVVFATLSLVLAWALSTVVVNFNKELSDRKLSNIGRLNPASAALNADAILKKTGAKVLVLWAADLQVNARTVMYMQDTSGPVGQLIGYTDQIYSNNNVMNVFMTQLMKGELNCGQVNTASKVGQYVAEVGAPSICRRGIMKDGVLVGYVSLSYPSPPNDADLPRLSAELDEMIAAALIAK